MHKQCAGLCWCRSRTLARRFLIIRDVRRWLPLAPKPEVLSRQDTPICSDARAKQQSWPFIPAVRQAAIQTLIGFVPAMPTRELQQEPTRPSVRAPSSASPGRCAAFSVRCAVSAALPGIRPSSRRLLPGFAIRRALRGCEMQQTCRTARPKLRLKPVLHISQVHAPR